MSEYLVERMICGGAVKICFVISPGKSDIMEYYGGNAFSAGDILFASAQELHEVRVVTRD